MKYLKLFVLTLLLLLLVSCATTERAKETCDSKYADVEEWVYFEVEEDSPVDLFIIPTTCGRNKGESYNLEYHDNAKLLRNFTGVVNMQIGIFGNNARTFSPLYYQGAMETYSLPLEEREPILAIAYADVRDAFLYYLENVNEGRPFLLAGFSQSGDMCLRLLKEFGKDKRVKKNLIACYALGWAMTEEEHEAYPYLKFAKGETDTGVIISFCTEAPEIEKAFNVARDEKMLSINPLNWRTDDTFADKSLNKGACFTNYSAEITKEIPEFTGAYLDRKRGTLKVTDIEHPEDYPGNEFCPEGVYHLYDYQFFFRNLEENVQRRTEAFLKH